MTPEQKQGWRFVAVLSMRGRTLLPRYRTWIVPDWKRLARGERHATVLRFL